MGLKFNATSCMHVLLICVESNNLLYQVKPQAHLMSCKQMGLKIFHGSRYSYKFSLFNTFIDKMQELVIERTNLLTKANNIEK